MTKISKDYLRITEEVKTAKALMESMLETNKQILEMHNKLLAQIAIVVERLHSKGCGSKKLVLNAGCCSVNNWADKTQKVSECIIYMFNNVCDAPHDVTCNFCGDRPPNDCNCWKTKILNEVNNFLAEMLRA